MCELLFHRFMRWNIEVVWRGTENDAEALLGAISPDDTTTFIAEIKKGGDDALLKIVVEAESLRSMRATINDILACLSAAESAINEA